MRDETASTRGEELELKLIATDRGVFDAVLARSELAGYQLQALPARRIRDRYWDTPDHQLRERGLALRLREEDGRRQFAIKGRASVERGVFRRREVESPADPDGWRAMLDELRAAGLALPAGPWQGSPEDWPRQAGLVLQQDRSTERTPLLVRQGARVVAELALDTTAYSVGVYEVIFREVEIESLTGETGHVVALGEALQRELPGRLLPSERGKYSRGLDLAARLA